MHGLVFAELQKFVAKALGTGAWRASLDGAGLESRIYLPVSTYPDEELERIVRAIAAYAKKPAAGLTEAFGEALAGTLIGVYKALLKPDWTTLAVLENVEGTIHKVVRIREPGARPPRLKSTRISPNTVEILYDSSRKMCSLAKGLARGVANSYDELLRVEEPECMHKGARACRLRFTVEARG